MHCRDVEIALVESRVREPNQFAVLGTVVDLQRADGQCGATELEEVGAILHLTPVPALLMSNALSLRRTIFEIGIVQDLILVRVDGSGEGAWRHLLLVARDDSTLGAEQRRHSVLHWHLRCLIIDYEVKEARPERQHTARNVRSSAETGRRCIRPISGPEFQ